MCHPVFLIVWWLKSKDSALRKGEGKGDRNLKALLVPAFLLLFLPRQEQSFKGKGRALYHPTTPVEECPTLQVDNLDGRFYSPKT